MSFKWVKLSDVCERITDGSHFSPKTVDEGFPYITVRDIDKDNINFESCKFVTKEDFSELSKNGCSPKLNDLLFSKDGTVGKVALVSNDVDFVVLSSLAILTPKLNIINPSFLFYVLKSPDFVNTAIGKKTGVAIRRIILKNLKEISIPLPSLLIQKKIVEKLDAIFAEIDKATAAAEANAKNAEALFQSYLTEVFENVGTEWQVQKLKDITSKITDGSHNPPKGLDFSNYLMFSSKNINNDSITFDSPRFLSKENYELENKRTQVALGDVLLTIVGTIGRCAVVEDAELKITLQRSVSVIKPKPIINSRFLMYFLQSINKLLNERARGVAQKGIYLETLRELNISFPDIKNQILIVARLDKIAEQILIMRESYVVKMTQLDLYKQSILQKAFSGELVKD